MNNNPKGEKKFIELESLTCSINESESQRLNFSKKINQKTVLDRLASLAKKGKSAPVVVELDLTSYCDYDCPECISSTFLGKERLKDEEINRIIESISSIGVRAVILTGGGEPLRHRSAGRTIHTLKENGLKVGLITNGLLLNSLDRSILKEIDWIRVSLDASCMSTYNECRPHRLGVKAFERVLSNIRYASNVANVVGVSFVALTRSNMSDNFNEIADCALLSKVLGARYLNVKAMELPDHNLYQYDENQIVRIKQEIDKAENFSDQNFSLIISSNLKAILSGSQAQKKSYARCLSSALRVMITSKGIYPCAYHRGNDALNYNPEREYIPARINNMLTYPHSPAVAPDKDCKFYCARHDANLQLESKLDALQRGESVEFDNDWDLFI